MTCKYEGDVSVSGRVSHCVPHGKGILTCYDEDGVTVSYTYEGAFVDGRMTYGTTTCGEQHPETPGEFYIGAHIKGYADGHGTWYYRDEARAYVGNFRRGYYDGQGTSYRNDGQIREDGTREDGTKEYEGQWEENCWRGVGILYRPDGTISRNGTWGNGGAEEYEWQEGEAMY